MSEASRITRLSPQHTFATFPVTTLQLHGSFATMKSPILLVSLVSLVHSISAQDSGPPGYTCHPKCITPTIPVDKEFSFGRHYAVLNLDLINALVGSVNASTAGQQFINSTARWIDAVHAQDPPPLSIFTRIYFSNARQPELGPQTPFAAVSSALGTAQDPQTQLYHAFTPDEKAGDVVLQKTRYYAGAGNALEEILSAQQIDTVVLSGIRTSGVVTSTAYRLFDLDYYV